MGDVLRTFFGDVSVEGRVSLIKKAPSSVQRLLSWMDESERSILLPRKASYFETGVKTGVFRSYDSGRELLRSILIVDAENRIRGSLTPDAELVQLSHLHDWLTDVLSEVYDRKQAFRDSIDPLGDKEESSLVDAHPGYRLLLERQSSMEKDRELVERGIEEKGKEIIPTVSALLGGQLGARILARAGSLKALARMPSSTVQLLGAEKSLFRHLLGKGSSPKHGLIFLHRMINSLPLKRRGRMARFLANKLSIGARCDYYGRRDQQKALVGQVEKRYEELRS